MSHNKENLDSGFCEGNLKKTEIRSITKNSKKENDKFSPFDDNDEYLMARCESESEIKEEISNNDDQNLKKKERKLKECSSNFSKNNDEGFMDDPEADPDHGIEL